MFRKKLSKSKKKIACQVLTGYFYIILAQQYMLTIAS